jgi:signal transduction histidine kinase
MLTEFLAGSRARILALARAKISALTRSGHGGAAAEERLPKLYQRLAQTVESAARYPHGRSPMGDDFALPQAAHGYVALGQAIAETATALGVEISPSERRALNRGLELAIADAAAGHKGTGPPASDFDETTRMGFLVHELRNALSCVFVAQAMLKKSPGASNALLERNLQNMRSMLDRASTEVRLHKEPLVHRTRMPLIETVREVAATAGESARQKGLTLSVSVDHRLAVSADGPLLVSALANLVQNAIKFTKMGGTIWVRGFEKERSIMLEVEDQCGGLPGGRIAKLFEPFTQMGEDRSGLGLGLAISRRAVELNGGTLSARDLPGKGCVFTIALPRVREPSPGGGRTAHHVTARS